MNPLHSNPQFEQAYQTLNTAQRLAVDTIENAVMVNAGPGTGKTQILALRIAHILAQTDSDPANILCLTYTENGAMEMRSRLLKIIGSSAYKIPIHTFHSFCNEVIQDNISYFGKIDLEPISDIETIELFEKLIDSIEAGNILKRFSGDVYFDKSRLQNLYSLMKKEAWTVDYLDERINAYVQELPTKEGFFYKKKYKDAAAGDPKLGAIKTETEKMEVLRAAVNLYPRYIKMMSDKNRYTYDDMILWVIEAFEKNDMLLRSYQEKFLYFLVDEFQDTSRSQNLILQYLTNYWDKPNLFVVGDADQSIFSFQDANVENILDFAKKHQPDLQSITLENNYRSSQVILDAAQKLIAQNKQRTIQAIDDKPLTAAQEAIKNLDILPSLVCYANPAQEAIDVVLQIEALLAQQVSENDIAVIYRNHKQVEDIAKMLAAKNIAVNVKRKIDVLQQPLITNILLLLTWIDQEMFIPYSAEEVLFKLLHADFFNLQPLTIAKINIAANRKNRGLKDDTYSIRRLLAESPEMQANLFDHNDSLSPKQISVQLENLLKESQNNTLQGLLDKVIYNTGILAHILKSKEKIWLMQLLTAFFNFVKEETKRKPTLSLHELLNVIDTMIKNKLAVPLHKITERSKGINLVTVHGAKGSEYAHVFVIGCNEKIWDAKTGGAREFALPDNLVADNSPASSLEESRRLFYVAITRAKTHLQISFTEKDNKDKEVLQSSFVTEIAEGAALPIQTKAVDDNQLADYLALQFIETARPQIALLENEVLDKILASYTLSVTHLNSYLDCPIRFYFNNLIKVPSSKNENMAFGTAVHKGLRMFFEQMRNDGNVFPPASELVKNFQFHMRNNREAFTPEQYKRRMEYGEKILPNWYNFYINQWNKIIISEKCIRGITVRGVPINGQIDKLEFDGKHVNVVDYKTGKYSNAVPKLKAPNEQEPNGGDYWRQAVFYKILIDNDTSNDWEAVSTEFDFLEPVKEEYKIAKISISPADVATVTEQITDTWAKIQNKEFSEGCGKPKCEWCAFVKENKIAIGFVAPEKKLE